MELCLTLLVRIVYSLDNYFCGIMFRLLTVVALSKFCYLLFRFSFDTVVTFVFWFCGYFVLLFFSLFHVYVVFCFCLLDWWY